MPSNLGGKECCVIFKTLDWQQLSLPFPLQNPEAFLLDHGMTRICTYQSIEFHYVPYSYASRLKVCGVEWKARPLQIVLQEHFNFLLFFCNEGKEYQYRYTHLTLVETFAVLPSAICLSKGNEHSMSSFPLLSVQFLPMMHMRRISCGSSKRSSSICLRAPALDPNSTFFKYTIQGNEHWVPWSEQPHT